MRCAPLAHHDDGSHHNEKADGRSVRNFVSARDAASDPAGGEGRQYGPNEVGDETVGLELPCDSDRAGEDYGSGENG